MGCTNSKSAPVHPKIHKKSTSKNRHKRKRSSLSEESSSEELFSESQVSEISKNFIKTSRKKKKDKKKEKKKKQPKSSSEIDEKTIGLLMKQLEEQKQINMNIFEVLKTLQHKQEDIFKEGSSGNVSDKLKSQTVALNRNQISRAGGQRLEGSMNNDYELIDKMSHNVTLPIAPKRTATRIGSIIHR